VIGRGEAWDLDALSSCARPSWSVEGGPERMHVIAHRSPGGQRLLVLVNDPAWVYTEQRVNKAGRPNALPAGVDVPPPP